MSCCKIPWMPEVFSLTSNEKRRERGVLVTLSLLRRSIPSSPKRKKKSLAPRVVVKVILQIEIRSTELCSARVYCPVYWGTPQKCTKFCQQVVYSQNDTLSGNSHITKGNKSPGDMARNFNLRY